MARTQVSACKFQDEQDLYAENGFNHFFFVFVEPTYDISEGLDWISVQSLE